MDNQRKWTGWLLISVIVLVAGVALVMTTLASPQPQPYPDATAPIPTVPVTTAPLQATEIPTQDSRTANASVIGYGGPVLVRLTLDERGAVEALEIGGARFQETEGVGSKVREEGFAETFIGRTPPFQIGENIDAISGATVSSTAAVEAVNRAWAFLNGSDTK